MQRILVAWRDGVGADSAVGAREVDGEACRRGSGYDALAVIRLAHVPLHEAGRGATAGLLVAQLALAQLAGVHRLRRAAPGCHGGEVLAVVGVGHRESGRTAGPARGGVNGGVPHAATHRTLGVLHVVGVWYRGRRTAAAVGCVAHGGEYLRGVHRWFEAIRRDEFDGPRVRAVRQKAAVRRCGGSVNGTRAVLRGVEAAVALVLDRVDVHHQISGLGGHQHDL